MKRTHVNNNMIPTWEYERTDNERRGEDVRYWKVMSQQIDDNYASASVIGCIDADEKPQDYVITWTRTPVFAEFFDSEEKAHKRVKQIKGKEI
jgi:hypothetical protein